ncbi:MAG: MBL fold metallo-hydrolase [Euryarchaeota archaeon]|nr:MBL fold metallo-hydrolase [Euryarchaeota archaeon]
MLLKKIKSEGLAHLSYIIGSKGSAVVIDPRRDCEIYLNIAKENKLTITHILETHRNEDYVTGSMELHSLTNARILHGTFDFRYGEIIVDGQEIDIGSITIRAISTPGHTLESMCYAVIDREMGSEVVAVFTGDTLFVGGVGRTDLYGNNKLDEMSAMQYDSLFNNLMPLGDGVIILPAHGAGSACGSNIADREDSTIGIERRQNLFLQVSGKDEFITLKRDEVLEKPHYFEKMEDINLNGQPILGHLPITPPIPVHDVQSHRHHLTIVDIRSPSSYAAAHVTGSLSIPLEILSHYGGWIIPYDCPILLVVDSPDQLDSAVRALIRTGYDDIYGYMDGGIEEWFKATLPSSSFPIISASSLDIENKDLFFLDIRMDKEWKSFRTEMAHHIFVGHIVNRINEIPVDLNIVILCSTGTRGSLAASILEKYGRKPINLLGGMTAWSNAGFPTISNNL